LSATPWAPGVYIRGGASRCDNYSISASNPDGSAIAEVMQSALSDCGLSRQDITAVKAHGTASPLNDDGEAAGLKRIFDQLPPLFALKPIVGHTLGACGVVETALVALALRRGFIPASAGFEQYDSALGITPLGAPLAMGAGHLMLNYFGFGGNNNALILEKLRW
jgi:3-oxoacyl-[acyl-carrier-protein] synthase-1